MPFANARSVHGSRIKSGMTEEKSRDDKSESIKSKAQKQP
jgi:hypothetical protein